MLFNSFNFLFIFLPLTFIIAIFLKKIDNVKLYILFLTISSLYFYSYFLTSYILILIGSILLNFFYAKILLKLKAKKVRLFIFITIIIKNIIILIYFKYFNFLIENFNTIFDTNIYINNIILPLAISFFTFQQITFITSVYKDEIKDFQFIKYAFFICFFPQLIAGPIIKFKELYPQILKSLKFSMSERNLTIGLIIFSIGMFKKIVISSYLATIADPVFNNIDSNIIINPFDAWIGLIAFSFQIYFDFSGYTDMAIGLAYCLGFVLPINFYSPYKSSSIKEFWTNWHITLSRFLKSHIYIPLGGNKNSHFTQFKNIFITMLIGGIWHGASWNFVLWGGYHGFLIIIEKILKKIFSFKLPHFIYKYIIFLLITIGWIPFRCQSIESIFFMLNSLFSFNNFFHESLSSLFLLKFLIIFVIFLLIMFLPNSVQIQKKIEDQFFSKTSIYLYLLISFSLIFFLLVEPSENINKEFIYFQF